jgi:hypothetical protein
MTIGAILGMRLAGIPYKNGTIDNSINLVPNSLYRTPMS